ncbi:MAG: TRAP transporter permease DctQ [Betaproteobacteria bacterium TMED100]|nr:MAG: TRAP transporter permease DctQ [Betaproteobacteria bacterium TMED100]|tara:strand:- start:1524 stop:2099 length:576 start_codon:yes stop_codon:yes gene_type:complete
MNKLKEFVFFIDNLSVSVGRSFAWCIIILILGTCYEVFMRYGFGNPTSWAFDMSYMLYGTIFMMAGAYTLARGGHVRGDFLYRRLKPKTQARIDLVLYVLFFFPGILAMVFSGYEYGIAAFKLREVSVNSPVGVPVWPIKLIILFSGFFLLVQGIAEVMRCIYCIKTGNWLRRGVDVDETALNLNKDLRVD